MTISPLSSFSQETAWYLKVDRSTDTEQYGGHELSTLKNQLVLDFSGYAKNRTPLKVELTKDATPNASFSFFTLIQATKGSRQDAVIVSNKEGESSLGWEITANKFGGWGWKLSMDDLVIAEYETTSPKYVINDGKFHMLGFSYDYRRNQVWIFFDDEFIGIIAIKNADISNFKNLYIGGIGTNEQTSFDGYFKSLYLFKNVITLSNVRKLFHNNPRYNPSIGINGSFYPSIKVLTWNISNAGIKQGNVIGPQRTLRILKDSKADIIALQQPKGYLEYLAEGLGYYFYSASSNLAILSRYPIKNTIKFFKSNKLAGIEISISKTQNLFFFNISLRNNPDWSDYNNSYTSEQFVSMENKGRANDIAEIMKLVDAIIKPKSSTSIIFSGEFNSISAKDDGGDYEKHPVSNILNKNNFLDSYRVAHSDARIYSGYTRNVKSKDKRKGRIDYIYFKGDKLRVYSSEVIKKHPIRFPSENYGVLTDFVWKR